ncbi:MAG: hypothetical protein IT302_11250 [Dehalococcoidia bacterium]|nr:hypothetical protein [Dehalococcoidia bacterium]
MEQELGQIRQGDVLLIPVSNTPTADAVISEEVVLALGEVTGHAHRLRGTAVLEWHEQGERFVRVLGEEMGTLSHEDHDPVPAHVVATEQTYRVIQQREWNLAGQWQQVAD